MEEKKKKKGFFSSLFAPKSCCCNVQFEKIPQEENSGTEAKKEDSKSANESNKNSGGCGC